MKEMVRRFQGEEGRRFMRYLAVGAWNTAFGYGVYAALTWWLTGRIRYAYMVASVVATVVSITMAFILYKLFVFRTRGNALKEFVKVNAVYGGTALLGFALLPVLVHVAAAVLDPTWAPYVAQAVLIPFTVAVSFVGHRRFSFRHREGETS